MRRTLSSRPVLALLALTVLGCGTGTPPGSAVSATTSAAPAATASALPDLTPATSPTPVPAPSAGAEAGVFRTLHVQPDGGGQLPIVLQDTTGLVVRIDAVLEAEPPFEALVTNPDGQPSVLRYQWIGGACDTLTSITFERAAGGFRLANTTKTTGDMCILIAIIRVVDIHLREPTEPGTVVLADR